MTTFSAPVRASLDVTYACDLRCIHCRTNTGEIPVHIRRRMLTIADIRRTMVELDRMGTFEITLTGGEPTLRRGFWDLLDVVPKLEHSTVTLITNTAAHQRRHLDQIVDSGITSVRVSMDGTRKVFEEIRLADVFDKVMENSAYLRDRVASFKVLTTVMRTNQHDVLNLTDQLREAGFRRQDLILVRAHGRGGRNRLLLTEAESMDMYRRVEEFRRNVPAIDFDLNLNAPYLVPAGFPPFQDLVMFPYLVRDSSIAISATGDVTMSRLYSAAPLGNVKDASVGEIWRNGQEQLSREAGEASDERLREIFWNFASDADTDRPAYTSLLDRQIFEGAEVR